MLSGYKTLTAGFLVAILGILEQFDVTQFSNLIPDQYEPMVFSGVGFLMVILRLVTKTTVTK